MGSPATAQINASSGDEYNSLCYWGICTLEELSVLRPHSFFLYPSHSTLSRSIIMAVGFHTTKLLKHDAASISGCIFRGKAPRLLFQFQSVFGH
jgi:hypothetical protein